MSENNVNLYVTLLGRYAGMHGLSKMQGEVSLIQRDFARLNASLLSESRVTQGNLERERRMRLSNYQLAVTQAREQKRIIQESENAVQLNRTRLRRLQRENLLLQERAEQGFIDRSSLRWKIWQTNFSRQQELATRNYLAALSARDAAILGATPGRAGGLITGGGTGGIGGGIGGAGAGGLGAAAGGGGLTRLAGNPYLLAGAALGLGGLYGAKKAADLYARFQQMTQATAANTNMTAAALRRYRAILPDFQVQYPAPMSDVNNAFFRALNLGFRTRNGAPNQRTYQFAREVMLSALPAMANPEKVANMLGGTINAYRNNAGAPRGASPDWFMNVIHAGGAAANMTVDQMAQFFGPVQALAATSNSKNSLRQALAMVGAMTQQGFTPQKASTDVAQIFQKMLRPPASAQNKLAQIYYKTGVNLWGDFTPQGLAQKGAFGVMADLRQALAQGTISKQDLLTIFPGTRGGQGLLSLLSPGGQQRMRQDYQRTSSAQAQGQTARQFQGWMQTRAAQTAQREAILYRFGLWAGAGPNAALTATTDLFNRLVIGADKWVRRSKVVGAGFVALGRGAVFFLKNLTPIGLGFQALSQIVGPTVTLFTRGLGPALTDIATRAKPITRVFGAIAARIKGLISPIRAWPGTVLGALAQGLNKSHVLRILNPPLSGLVAVFSNAFAAIADKARGLGGFIAGGIGTALRRRFPGMSLPGAGTGTGASPTPNYPDLNPTKLDQIIRAAGSVPTGYPSPARFGLPPPTWYRNSITQPYSSYITQQDNAGLAAFGGGPAVNDWNFGEPTGTPVRLPIRAKLLRLQSIPGGGGYAYFRAVNGGIFFFEHLQSFSIRAVGRWYNAGTLVGTSGRPTSANYGQGAQLSLSADARASRAIMTGRSGIGGGPGRRVAAALPTPPPPGVGATGTGPTITPWERRNWGMLRAAAARNRIPLSALLAILNSESSGGMNTAAGANVMQVTPIAMRQVRFTGNYQTSAGASVEGGLEYLRYLYNGPARRSWWTAFQMYNGSGPDAIAYANRTYAAANAYGLGRLPAVKIPAPYATALFSERRRLANLTAAWTGIRVSGLPAEGKGRYTQANYLKYQYARNQLLRQIADNTARQFALSNHMSAAWLAQMLKQDRETLNRRNQAARNQRLQRVPGYGGAAGSVVPVHIIGRCDAEAKANKIRAATAERGKEIAGHTHATARGIAKLIDEVRKLRAELTGLRVGPSAPPLPYFVGTRTAALPGH